MCYPFIHGPLRRSAVLLLCLLTATALRGQVRLPDPDSLYRVLEQHTQGDTNRVKTLLHLCYYEYSADPEKEKIHAEEALRLSQKLNYTYGITYAYRYTAYYYNTKNQYTTAISYALKALKTAEDSGDAALIAKTLGTVGRIHDDMGNYTRALTYYRKSLAINLQRRDDYEIGYSYNALGALYYELDKMDSAIIYYKLSLAIREKMGDENAAAQSFINLGLSYQDLGQDDLAIQYFNRALPSARKINNKSRIFSLSLGLGKSYTVLGDYAKAELALMEGLQMARELGSGLDEKNAYSRLRDLESARGNYKRALDYARLRSDLQDSLYDMGNAQQVTEMEKRYETDKKEHAIKLLEKEKQIEEFWRVGLLTAIVSGCIAFTVIFLLQRSRNRKSRELLEVQRVLNTKLGEVDRAKSRFFANISHEFRTPLTLILAPLDEKLKKPLTTEEREITALMRRNAQRLLNLVNQLLDLSRLDAGKMTLTVRPGDLNQFLKVFTASFNSLAQHKDIHFITEIQPLPDIAWFDEDKLEKIITNILINAFKFTPEAGIVTFVAWPRDNRLSIVVTDTGIGIPESEQQEIFSPFYQGSRASEGIMEGAGLGLPLVKELLKVYGGHIDLTSRENHGTTVSLSVPFTREDFTAAQRIDEFAWPRPVAILPDEYTDTPPADDTEESPDTKDKDTLLVVEDNTDLRNFMMECLSPEFHVLTAANGEEGVGVAIGTIPSLILSDLMMPRMDGMALTRVLKTDERTSHIPIILLTAKDDSSSRIQGLNTGADDYLTKPFSYDELRARIHNLIRQRRQLAERYRDRVTLPTTTEARSMDEKFLQKSLAIVERHLDDSSFSVEKMAEEVGLSRTQLLRKIKALTGLSPSDLIRDLRLQKAAELIRRKADTVTQIGYHVGFSDQSYFAKCFKKKYGVSPSEYQG